MSILGKLLHPNSHLLQDLEKIGSERRYQVETSLNLHANVHKLLHDDSTLNIILPWSARATGCNARLLEIVFGHKTPRDGPSCKNNVD